MLVAQGRSPGCVSSREGPFLKPTLPLSTLSLFSFRSVMSVIFFPFVPVADFIGIRSEHSLTGNTVDTVGGLHFYSRHASETLPRKRQRRWMARLLECFW